MSAETATGFALRTIRNEIIEQCARVADAEASASSYSDLGDQWNLACHTIAKAIRALAVSPSNAAGTGKET